MSWPAVRLTASQEWLSSLELIGCR
jgi:hypothetical protein